MEQDFHVSRKRVIRLMQEDGLKARPRKRFKCTTMSDGGSRPRNALCRAQHDAVREQSSRSLSSADPPTRTTDAKPPAHAQRFLSVHGLVRNLFRVGRHLLQAAHHRGLRTRSFLAWNDVTCAC